MDGPVIGARTDHKVALLLEVPILVEDSVVQFLFLVSRDQVARRSISDPKSALKRDRNTVPPCDECYQVIGIRPLPANGAKEGDFATMPRQQLHHPKDDDGFPVPWPRPCYVNALRHVSPPSVSVFIERCSNIEQRSEW